MMVWILTLVLANSRQDVRVSSTEALLRAVSEARAGSRILIEPGRYSGGLHFQGVRGEPERSVIIAASDPKRPPVFTGGGSALQFSSIQHVEIRDLVIERPRNNGLNIDDGGQPDRPSRHVRITNLRIRDLPNGNNDGIKLSGVQDFLVEGCTVERWGGSAIDMVGCHRGRVEDCSFRSGGDSGVQAKGGSSNILVRQCTFEQAGQRALNLGGSTGEAFFRPPLAKMEAHGRYEARGLKVEHCTIVGGLASIAFVGVVGAEVSHCTIYMPDRWVIRILQETNRSDFLSCQQGVFTDNIVMFNSKKWASGGVNVGPGTKPETFRFERNFWFCSDDPRTSTPALPTKERGGVYGQNPSFTDPAGGDFRLRPGSPARGYGRNLSR